VGSDILERIHQTYPDLSLIWLITGKGDMIFSDEPGQEANDAGYVSDGDEVVHLLKDKIKLLENSVADKGKIISLMEARVKKETKEIVPAQGKTQRKK